MREFRAEIKAIRAEIHAKAKAEIKSRVAARVRATVKEEIRKEIEEELRVEIESKIRAEFRTKPDPGKLAPERNPNSHLDPSTLLASFSEEAKKLLQEIHPDSATPQQLANAIRQAVLNALRTRKIHLSQLVEIDRLQRQGVGAKKIGDRVSEWFTRAGLSRVEELNNIEYFDIQGNIHDGDFLALLEPAYVDEISNQLIQPGRAKIISQSYGKGNRIVRRSDLLADASDNEE
ncbi:hypothetical protein [Microbispora amethystogenes]|uniref:Uncharacterized protein n=1 Tax=Microbispora amethystogenes TaxID=1427754 RepID=A0ABQ4FN88_9ACTN|nr:hypothetical protein [Microbispora amethystogenes]GIH36270.1 hypothetical protein Mam01_64340 [Microbispora amethystogenes]